MNDSIKIKADKEKLSEYIADFENGNLQVPAFQRDFVWLNDKKLELFDSIKKGYPIGSILCTEIDNLSESDLNIYNFKNLKREVILQCITNSFGGVYFDQVS